MQNMTPAPPQDPLPARICPPHTQIRYNWPPTTPTCLTPSPRLKIRTRTQNALSKLTIRAPGSPHSPPTTPAHLPDTHTPQRGVGEPTHARDRRAGQAGKRDEAGGAPRCFESRNWNMAEVENQYLRVHDGLWPLCFIPTHHLLGYAPHTPK